MKAAVYFGKEDLRLSDIPVPECGPGEVRIRVAYCGVCGTDHHIYHGDGGAAPVTPGTVIGHEFSGTVDAVGSGVTRFSPGDRVAADPNDWCGKCGFCLRGMPHFCENMKGYGTTAAGGFAEHVCVPEKQVYRLPEGLGLKAGSQCETVSCCVNGIDLCAIRPGASVLVIGAGPIGLMMMQLARSCGAGRVVVSELVESKRALALSLGADTVIDPAREDLQAALARECGNVDCVIEAAGTKATQEAAIAAAGKGGTVMLFGLVAPDTVIPVKPFDIFRREIRIASSFINPFTFGRAVSLLASRRLLLDDIITDIVPLEEIGKVFVDPYYRSRGKVLIRMAGGD